MKNQSIKKIRKRFHREWLLIAVDKMDEQRCIPLRGHLLVHSPHRDEIYDASLRRKGLALTTFSDDRLPAGYATAF